MPDYGHVLQFGTFITPTNQNPQVPVQLAVLSEQLGYDLVTFQDHPYQPGFLDTWTLLSWVAARTERIHVSGNVLNLPLRQPAVLARSAASLDLLSGGRFDLGLGAGGFWDAIASMGAPKRTPGEGVQALEEAIEIIRGIWDADERRPLRTHGEFHHVDGAKRGPLPAHAIPIWLGALKPRMLRLIGRKADGWLPSLAYLEPGGLAAGNGTIDEAAQRADRDPAAIRRLINIMGRFRERGDGMLQGPAAQWVEDLLPLALEDGVGTFILASDDPAMMQEFAEEVAPALREAVSAERGRLGVVDGARRDRIALAKRRDGIDYDGLPASLASRAVEPGDFGYSRVSSTYMRGGSPGLVLRVATVSEVAEAVLWARQQDAALAVRSGGHGISGRSTNDGGIIIDLGALDGIEVLDEASRRVRIGPGARWKNVAAALQSRGWALSSGDYGGVGVGGLATAGGIGFLVREHGLTIDHLRAVEMVLADGRIVRASTEENPDLFWAVRGAGANFGIVTSFEFEVDEVGEIGWAQLAFDASETEDFLFRWGTTIEAAPRDVTSFALLGAPSGGQQIAHVFAMVDSDDPDTIIARLQPFAEAGPLVQQSVQLSNYAAVMANSQDGPHMGRGDSHSRSGLLERMTPEFAQAAADLLRGGAVQFFQLRSVGGAVADVAADATAYSHRSASFSVIAMGANPARLDAAWSSLAAHFDGLYLSFDTRLGADVLEQAFPPDTLARLRILKAEWDPANVFRDNFNITVSESR